MSTEEKNKEIKIKKIEEKKSSQNRYNISGSKEMKEESKNSSQISGEENREIANLNISSQQKNTNSKNSKIIKEKSEEIEHNPNSFSKKNNSNSENNENKSQSKEQEENSDEKNESNSKVEEENSESSEKNENNHSSFLNSRRYDNLDENENNEIDDSNEGDSSNNYLKRKDPFMTTGKFMQIQPHFNIFSQRVENLREGIYNNTKKCLMYKSSLQYSENLMRERANSIVKDMVEKIFNMRKMFLDSNKEINGIISDTDILALNLTNGIDRNKKELNICQNNIHKCEGQIGYKLLGKPNYSFMQKTYSNMANKKI